MMPTGRAPRRRLLRCIGQGLAALALAVAAVRCAGPLPSDTPLGRGPLAIAEDKVRAEREAAREQALADAGSGVAQKAPPPKAAANARRDAGKPEDGPSKDKAAVDAGGASESPAAKGAKALFAGLYVGEDRSVFKLSGLPDRDEKDPNAKTRVEDRSDGGVDLIPVDSSNGKDICRLQATAKDKTRTVFEIKRGQRCFEPEQGGMSGTIRSGTAKFNGKKLVIDVVLALEVDTEQLQLSGSLEYHFQGDKQ